MLHNAHFFQDWENEKTGTYIQPGAMHLKRMMMKLGKRQIEDFLRE